MEALSVYAYAALSVILTLRWLPRLMIEAMAQPDGPPQKPPFPWRVCIGAGLLWPLGLPVCYGLALWDMANR